MKVKKLLKVLYNTEYIIKTDYGTNLERGFSGTRYDSKSGYGDRQIKTLCSGYNHILCITIKEKDE